MAEEGGYHVRKTTDEYGSTITTVKDEPRAEVETQDRGLFDFLGKKEEEKKLEEEVIVSEFEERVYVSEPEPKVEEECKEEEKKDGLFEKLRQTGSRSCSSRDEEEVEEGEGLKEKILGDHKKEEKKHEEDTCVPVEKYNEDVVPPQPTYEPEEKKGILEKIKEKLPGHKKTEEEVPPPPPVVVVEEECATVEVEAKEKKGILEKIKEKLPGYHSKPEEQKEKEKESASDY